jgi:hypothetical protein
MEVPFRPPRAAKYQFLVVAALFFAAAIGVPLHLASLDVPAAHCFNGEHSLVTTAVAVIVALGGMGMLSVLAFASLYRYQLTITTTGSEFLRVPLRRRYATGASHASGQSRS